MVEHQEGKVFSRKSWLCCRLFAPWCYVQETTHAAKSANDLNR